MSEDDREAFARDAIQTAVHAHKALSAQGGAIAAAAFGVAAVELQQRLHVSLAVAAVLLQQALH